MSGRLPVEPIFDQAPQLFGDGPPNPVVYDASARALRQRTVNFAAKRYADMMFVSGLDRATADRHFRPRAALVPGGLSGRPAGLNVQDALRAAVKEGRFTAHTDAAARWVARWRRRHGPVGSWTIRDPGTSVTVAKSVDALIWEGDGRPRT